MMNTILITAIGTMNATAIIKELRLYLPNLNLIGADIFPKEWIANSQLVDEFYQFPRADVETDKYVDFVFNFCKTHSIDCIYCVIDDEVQALSERRDEFRQIGTAICIADEATISLCHNKIKFTKWLNATIPDVCIRTYSMAEEIETYPVFVKPMYGRASIGCKKIYNKKELDALKINWRESLVQEFIEGDVIAVDVVSNQKFGQFQCCQRKELLRNSNGCGVAVEIIADKRIEKTSKQIVEKLHVNGVINIEYFMTKDSIKIIEINPRLSAGTMFSCMAGLNTVINALHIEKSEPCDMREISIGAQFAKRYETYQTH